MKHLLFPGGLVTALWACAIFSGHTDERISSVSEYKRWAQATKGAVKMSPRLWMLCRPPTPAEQKELDEFNRNNPHSDGYLRVYMNELASGPMRNGTKFAPGSILVKEKMVGPGTGLIARAVMRKHEKGWNPNTGDWEFYVLDKDMELENAKNSACISCHRSQSWTNWVYRTYIRSGAKR